MLPHEVSVGDLEAASARVGERHGWDFSKMQAVRDEPPWDYEATVLSLAFAASAVLDVGTGGGELLGRLIRDADWDVVVAVDQQERMATVAAGNLGAEAQVVVADAPALPFEDASFDLILQRHCVVNPPEVARLLGSGGKFVTQQVGPHNTQSIFDAFGWGSNWEQFAHDDPPPRRCVDLATDFEALGIVVERVDEYDVGYAFENIDSLVFFLKAVPLPEAFDPARHADAVNRLLANNLSNRGIETTEHRELLVVRSN